MRQKDKMTNKELIAKAIEFAKPYYQLPHRINGYHSWGHIQEGVSLYEKYFKGDLSEECELAFYLAWIFHDAVYIGSSSNNEEESEKLFTIFCAKHKRNITEKLKDYVSELILCTKTHSPVNNKNIEIKETSKILNDIDQAYLGYDFVNFMRKRSLVRNDYLMYSDKEYKEGTIIFCYQYLTQDFTFFTEKFQNLFQNNVFSNLDKYVHNLQSNKY
jgi:predicted metal-dependent HD superfamily phosphohydrolase